MAMTIESLQKELAKSNERIANLEKKMDTLRARTNVVVNGQAIVLKLLIAHTGCPPPKGQQFSIGGSDVGDW